MFSREAEAGHSSFFFWGGGLLLSPEAATHIPGQPWSYAACAWIIRWHSSPGRLVHSAPWEGAAHGASSLRLTGRTGEVLCHPRPTLVRWTILLLSANRDPVTYRPNINNRASTLPPPPSFFIWKSKPPPPQSTALLQQRDGSGSLRVGGSVLGQLHHTKPRKQASMQDHDTNTDTWLEATAVWSWKKCPDLANPLFFDLDYCAARTTSSATGGFGLQ